MIFRETNFPFISKTSSGYTTPPDTIFPDAILLYFLQDTPAAPDMIGPLEVREEQAAHDQDNIVPDSHCQDNEILEADNSIREDTSRADNSPTTTSAEKNDNIPSTTALIVDDIPSAPTMAPIETEVRKSIRQGK